MKNIHYKYILGCIVLILLSFNFVFAYNNFQNTYPILGIRFEGRDISFVNRTMLEHSIKDAALRENASVTFTYNGQTYTISQQDVGYRIDPAYTTNSILMSGRKGNIFQKLFTQIAAVFGLEDLTATGTFSKALLSVQLLEIQNAINQKPLPIRPDFANDSTKTLPAQDGIQIDSLQLANQIRLHFHDYQSAIIPLPVTTIHPQYHAENELTPIREQAVRLIQNPITITSVGQYFTLTPKDLKNLLTVVERPDPQNPKKTKLTLRLDDTKLSQKLGDFAAKVETITHTEFNYEDALAVIYGQFYFGTRAITVIPTGSVQGSPNVLGAKTSSQKIAYLTFDDGPNTIYHPLILDILKHYHVKATFFLIGQNVLAAQDVAKRTYSDGHLVGNHTLTHAFLPNYSSAFIANEMTSTNIILESINGKQPVKLFRPPYGGVNATVIQDAHTLGLQVFLWDVDPRDWSEPPKDVLIHRVIDYVHSGSNVLLHSNHSVTVEALPQILQTLIAQGYTFETLDKYPSPEEL